MDHGYIAAQIIGFIGYGIYIAGPHFKNPRHVVSMDMLACLVLAGQWALLGHSAFVISNFLAIGASAVALSQLSYQAKDRVLLAFYPLSILMIATVWEGSAIDYLSLAAQFCMISSRRARNEQLLRIYCMSAGLILAVSGALTLTIPALIFNAAVAVGHLQKLCEPLLERRILRLSDVQSV